MKGVAHTTGTKTDKEIHFSLEHIENCASRARDEILGVLTHEVVHCFQYDAERTCPSGLIEGVSGESSFSSLLLVYALRLTGVTVLQTMFDFAPALRLLIGNVAGEMIGMLDTKRPATFLLGSRKGMETGQFGSSTKE